jgi:large subunit ribosomal protein L4
MYKATYYKADGKKGRARALPDWLFDGVVNEGALHQVVKAYLANQRQGTAAAKNRSAVRGGANKPYRQKGTGRARQGTIRAPQFDGGGVAFPPIPHSWNQKVPKKMKGLARRSAFNARAEENRVILVDALSFEGPKTAQLRDYLGAIQVQGKVLFLTEGMKQNVYLSARNLPNVEVRPFGEESAYDILWANTVIIERGALENAEAPPKPGKGAEKKKGASDA